MAELSAGLATLSLFLAWRLYVVSTRLIMANHMLMGMIDGKVSVTRTEDGIELEIKRNA
jgi:hypothetical protein